jgi:transposase
LAFPDLSGARLLREIREMGYEGGYTAVTDFLHDVRPPRQVQFERRFETPPGKQAQADFAEFTVEFTDEPGVVRKVWLFSMVLGHSRWLWGRFVASQNLQSVLRCHIAERWSRDFGPKLRAFNLIHSLPRKSSSSILGV